MGGNTFSVRNGAVAKVGGNTLVAMNGRSAVVYPRLGRLLMVDRLTPLRSNVAERMHLRAVRSATVQNRVMTALETTLPGVGKEVAFVPGFVPGGSGYFERSTVKRSAMGLRLFEFEVNAGREGGPVLLHDMVSGAFYEFRDGGAKSGAVKSAALVRNLVIVTEVNAAASKPVAYTD